MSEKGIVEVPTGIVSMCHNVFKSLLFAHQMRVGSFRNCGPVLRAQGLRRMWRKELARLRRHGPKHVQGQNVRRQRQARSPTLQSKKRCSENSVRRRSRRKEREREREWCESKPSKGKPPGEPSSAQKSGQGKPLTRDKITYDRDTAHNITQPQRFLRP